MSHEPNSPASPFVFDGAQTRIRRRRESLDLSLRGRPSMVFSILSRVQVEGGAPVAVAVALPMKPGVLAEVRTHKCSSREEAVARLDSMVQSLRLDVVARGDSFLVE